MAANGDDPVVVRFDLYQRGDYQRVVALLIALTGSKKTAEFVTRRTFAKAQRIWPDIRLRDPDLWIRRTALAMIASRRRRTASRAYAIVRLWRSTRRDLGGATAEFWLRVRRFPDNQPYVFALTYVDELDQEEVASLLGLTESEVQKALFDSRLKFSLRRDHRGETSGEQIQRMARALHEAAATVTVPAAPPPPP